MGSHLRNNCQPGPELVQSHESDVFAVDDDGAASGFDDPEQGQGEGGLTSPCAADDAHLLARADHAVNALQDQIQTFAIPEGFPPPKICMETMLRNRKDRLSFPTSSGSCQT